MGEAVLLTGWGSELSPSHTSLFSPEKVGKHWNEFQHMSMKGISRPVYLSILVS